MITVIQNFEIFFCKSCATLDIIHVNDVFPCEVASNWGWLGCPFLSVQIKTLTQYSDVFLDPFG